MRPKRRFRRTLLTVLSLTLVLAAAAVSGELAATAAGGTRVISPVFSDIAGVDGEFELSALGALGVFTGDAGLGGPVRPADPITRAEFCKVIVSAMGKTGIAASLRAMTPDYTDGESIPTWAWGYVNTARMMGVVDADPYGDGTFRPHGLVSRAEALTMLVRAVPGHRDRVEEGPWPFNYISYALANGFVGRVDLSSPHEPCSRSGMAVMLFNTQQVGKLDPFGAEVPASAVLSGRILKGRLLEYALEDSLNYVTLDLNGNGQTDGNELLTLGSTLCLAGRSLESLRTLEVTAITGTGEDEGEVIFIGVP